VKLLHRNICPESIIININGAWKLAGFELFVTSFTDPNGSLRYPFKEWDGSAAVVLNQPLEYLAPEYAISSTCDTASDMFSYGMLFFTVYNNGNSLYKCNNNYSTYVNQIEDLKKSTASQFEKIPFEIREYIKLLMHINPELRPDASQVMKVKHRIKVFLNMNLL
jgi:SCY1-like protein 2